MSLRYAHLAPDQRREAVAKLNERAASYADDAPTVGGLSGGEWLPCCALPGRWGYRLSRRHVPLPRFWFALISAVENTWISRSKSAEGRLSALTVRLRRTAYFDAAPHHADSIGGKGGTRTLDPGIMRIQQLAKGRPLRLARRSTIEHHRLPQDSRTRLEINIRRWSDGPRVCHLELPTSLGRLVRSGGSSCSAERACWRRTAVPPSARETSAWARSTTVLQQFRPPLLPA